MSMKKVFSWSTKYILFPLIPFLLGSLMRYFYQELTFWSILDPSDLSFSMTIICFLAAISARKLRDEDLADGLSIVFFGLMFTFLVAFVCVGAAHMEIEESLMSSIEDINDKPENYININQTISHNLQIIEKSEARLSKITKFEVVLSCITIPSIIILKIRYKLGE
ncbi:MAG: hypothetical protein JW878_05640 [Methanomicrobia archaeon]|nr:hypothetical protein [Methanomicrobia archaeon]